MSDESEFYGKSPAVTALPAWKALQLADERDIKLMESDDEAVSGAAQERFMSRRRYLWHRMGLA